jgi:hypothetical protein
VSLALGDVVSRIIIQSLHLRVGESESHLAKKLLQQNPHLPDVEPNERGNLDRREAFPVRSPVLRDRMIQTLREAAGSLQQSDWRSEDETEKDRKPHSRVARLVERSPARFVGHVPLLAKPLDFGPPHLVISSAMASAAWGFSRISCLFSTTSGPRYTKPDWQVTGQALPPLPIGFPALQCRPRSNDF